jgi:ribonuclease HI
MLLKPLLDEALKLIRENFDNITFSHIYRRDNGRADELANEAMDDYSINLKT